MARTVIHATVIKFAAKGIITLVILIIALAIQESTAVLPEETLGSPTLSDVSATQNSIAAHVKLGERTQIAHLAIQ
jgi:ABC-type phosphate transport system permease subunit